MRARPWSVAAILLLGTVLAAAGFGGGWVAHQHSPQVKADSARLPGVSECGADKPVERPQSITLTCADGGELVRAVNWTMWDRDLAQGFATLTVNNCEPSCVEGEDIDYPVKVLLDRVKTNGSGPQFSRLVILYEGRSPNEDNDAGDVFDLDVYAGSP